MTNAKEIARLKKAVNVARKRARKAEKVSAEAKEASVEIVERSRAYILELGKWRTALGFLEKNCNDKGKKLLHLMFDWYNRFLLGPVEEETEGHPPSGMCVKCPYHS